ncbi:unnamed protein product [Rangifer tarandus platyrhynchus]|uniref:Uncharacterized protein n=1 Tax=Rangifer tarandus platyrhynchus TaxID=3082113 RepID=A0ABN8YVN8_RANTA|nr:unnamed protein product [Rangifer tarandus platyrhynchus]
MCSLDHAGPGESWQEAWTAPRSSDSDKSEPFRAGRALWDVPSQTPPFTEGETEARRSKGFAQESSGPDGRPGWDVAGPGAQTEEQVLPGAGAALAVRASGPYTAPAPRCDLESLPPLRPQSSQQAVDAFELGCGLDSGIQVAAVCQVRKLVVLLFGAISSTVWAQKGGSSPSLLQETGTCPQHSAHKPVTSAHPAAPKAAFPRVPGRAAFLGPLSTAPASSACWPQVEVTEAEREDTRGQGLRRPRLGSHAPSLSAG